MTRAASLPKTTPVRVCRGVAFLDENVPGWETMIDLDDLDLEKTERCILGQLWNVQHGKSRSGEGAFYRQLREFFPDEDDWERDRLAVRHGFDTLIGNNSTIEDAYDRLTFAWRRVIRFRLRRR